MIDRTRVSNGATAAMVAAIAGAVGLVAIILFFAVGQPFGALNDLAGLVMLGSLAPVMLAHYELGGVVPLWPARLSLGGALVILAAWSLIQLAFVLGQLGVDVVGMARIDVQQPATGAWAVQAVLLAGIGLWIAGASLLAGGWLPITVRALGIVTGIGLVVMAYGLVQRGYSSLWANVGGAAYQIVLPVWAFLLGRVFRAKAAAATPAPGAVAA